MKFLTSAALALSLVASVAALADDTEKVGKGAEQTGKTVVHGTQGVGKGASKIFHDMATGVHKIIAKNTKDPYKKASHMEKAHIHHRHASRKAHEAKKEIDVAGKDADKIDNPK